MVSVGAMTSPQELDALFETAIATNKTVAGMANVQQRHGNRLAEIQKTLDMIMERLRRPAETR